MRLLFVLIISILLPGPKAGIALQPNDPVLIRIDNTEITKSHFEEVYRRNNLEVALAEPLEVDEYLEMYINFRLKVMEAKDLGLDTNATFIEELNGYRDQLAEQYILGREITGQLVKEAWERSQYDIRASHILMNLNRHAPPEDTLSMYQQAMEVRQRIIDGESFADLAKEVSDDPSARDRAATGNQPARRGNAGDLGYFTVFNMAYPFESAAYNTQVGEISMPFRTTFGYHLVKVTDRLPAMGTATVAHIMLMTPPGTAEEELITKEEKIQEVYDRLISGEDFGELAKEYSEDRQSAERNGQMPPFTTNRIVPQFVETINTLEEPGEISQPFKSDFGWHIVKLIEKSSPPPFEEAYADLENRIQRSNRSQIGKEVVIERLKKEYDLQHSNEAIQAFYDVVDESVFEGQWDKGNASHLDDQLISFGTQTFTQQDFADYIYDNQRKQNPMDIPNYIYMLYKQFVNENILAYEDSKLKEKYPEFKKIMQEYHDGILLFEITNQKVWSKAPDSTGLKKYFEDNKEQYQADNLSEVRGMVIADYQNQLEKEWVKALRKKYSIWINEELLEQISID